MLICFPKSKKIIGDRDGGLDALAGKSWDVVIDTCGYVPRIVRTSAEFLKDQVQHYVFISTISVYDMEALEANSDENAPLATMEDETNEEITGETYGALKVLCENVVQEIYPQNSLIVRPGLVVGPHDPSNRFTYWTTRADRGGEILAGGKPEYPTQFIDTRDLAKFTLDMTEKQATGIYHATGPDYTLELGTVIQACIDVADSDATVTWVDDEFLQENKVGAYVELPLWIPAPAVHNLNTVNIQKAIDAGLTFRPLEETVRDTLEWARPFDEPVGHAGMTAETGRNFIDGLERETD